MPRGSGSAEAGCQVGRSSPISSWISRTAHSGMVSPASILPLGQDQSSYRGRWISRTSRRSLLIRHGSAPAAVTATGSPGWSVWSATGVSLANTAALPAAQGALAWPRCEQPGLDVVKVGAVVGNVVPVPVALVVQVPAGRLRVHVAAQQVQDVGDVIAGWQAAPAPRPCGPGCGASCPPSRCRPPGRRRSRRRTPASVPGTGPARSAP